MLDNKLKPHANELSMWVKSNIKSRGITKMPILQVKQYLMELRDREKLDDDEMREIFNYLYGNKFELDEHLDVARVIKSVDCKIPYEIPAVKINPDYKEE